MDHKDQPSRYDIRVRGLLSDTLVNAFPELRPRYRGGVTVLEGELPDQAALHGVLARIEALGLELLEVRRVARRPIVPRSHPATSGAWSGRRHRLGPDGGRSTTGPPGEKATDR